MVEKLKEIKKAYFGIGRKNQMNKSDNTAEKETKESFSEVLRREEEKLREVEVR